MQRLASGKARDFPKFKILSAKHSIDLSYLDVLAAAGFYQLVLYMAMRLAHHSLTLGELGLAAYGAVILYVETLHVTIAKVSLIHVHF